MKKLMLSSSLVLFCFSMVVIQSAMSENKDPFFESCRKESENKKLMIDINGKSTCIVVRNVYCSKNIPAFHYSECGRMNEQTRIKGANKIKEICPDTFNKLGNPCSKAK